MKKINPISHIFYFWILFLSIGSIKAQNSIRPDTIPFQIGSDQRIYVSTHINHSSQTFRFLIDTGATDIVLNSAIAEIMELASFSEVVNNNGATSSEQIPATPANQSIQIGNSLLKGVRFIAIGYPPEAWDGVLGLSFLKNYDVVIQYDRKEMYLYPKGRAPRPKEHPISFEYIAGVPIIPVQVTINGKQHQLKVELDSGSDRILDLNSPYVKKHQLRGTLPVFAISRISGTGNNLGELENVCFDTAQIGDTTFPLLPGAFSTLTSGLQATDAFDGVIGNNLLQRFNQTWDFTKKQIHLTVNHRYYLPFYDFLIAK